MDQFYSAPVVHFYSGQWCTFTPALTFTKDEIELVRGMFEKAIEIDPTYCRAFAMISYSHSFDNILGYSVSIQDSLKLAIGAARKAIELDDGDPFGHRVLGVALQQDQQFDQAHAEKQIALDLNPYDAAGLFSFGQSLTLNGQPEEAINYFNKGFTLNPRDPRDHIFMGFMARAQIMARQYETAVEWALKAAQQRPSAPEPHLFLAISLGHLARIDEARAELKKFEQLGQAYQWPHTFKNEADNEHFLDGLRKAGWEG